MNMKEMLSTRMEHEALTEKVRDFLEGEGYETFTLSTESCDFCEHCAYLDGKPCRFPEHMHPCGSWLSVLLIRLPGPVLPVPVPRNR